jgi:hypothetical protein
MRVKEALAFEPFQGNSQALQGDRMGELPRGIREVRKHEAYPSWE